jgi:hypothetical protein
MAVTHTNRKKDTYFLMQGETKTGKPKYYFTRTNGANAVTQVPEGYEIYEKPESAQVFLRKVMPTLITSRERETALKQASKAVSEGSILVDVEPDSIVVYYAPSNRRLFEMLLGRSGLGLPAHADAAFTSLLQYEKALRFTLFNRDRRTFHAAHWRSKGSIDDWIPLVEVGPLGPLVAKHAQHLGKESYFELF